MVLIHPYAKPMRNGMPNPKTYPYWKELISLMEKEDIIQIGVNGEKALVKTFKKNLPLTEIMQLIQLCDYWVAVDSFLPHLAQFIGKPGVVLWSVSDPIIFGYSENLNLLKDRKYLRDKQFDIWEAESYNPEAFMTATEVYENINKLRGPSHASN